MQSKRSRQPREARTRTLGADKLRDLALHYVSRYATTEVRLLRYLNRKIGEANWTEETPPEPEKIIARMVALGQLNDETFATMKRDSLLRRGYGMRRVRQTLANDGIAREISETVIDARNTDDEARNAAHAYARRRRFGPYSDTAPDAHKLSKQLAAMCRAGHDYRISRHILDSCGEIVHGENQVASSH